MKSSHSDIREICPKTGEVLEVVKIEDTFNKEKIKIPSSTTKCSVASINEREDFKDNLKMILDRAEQHYKYYNSML